MERAELDQLGRVVDHQVQMSGREVVTTALELLRANYVFLPAARAVRGAGAAGERHDLGDA